MRYAIVDIGSNSVKISVATISKKNYTVDFVERVPFRLLEKGNLEAHEEKIETLLKILLNFSQIAKRYDADLELIATSAMRRASNAKDISERVKKQLGLTIEIIEGVEEARLVMQGHRAYVDFSKGSYLIVDVGGGSAELIWMNDDEVLFSNSLPLGSLVIKDMFEDKGWGKSEIAQVFFEIQNILKEYKVPKIVPKTRMLVSGGNPSMVSKMNIKHHKIKLETIHMAKIYLKELNEMLLDIKNKDLSWVQKVYQVSPHRIDLIKPTIVLLGAIMDYVGVKGYEYSKTGIREGRIFEKMLSLSTK